MNAVVCDAFNEQIKHEFFSSYLYLSMSAHFNHANLPGFAHWMRLQAQEEVGHGVRLFDFVLRRGGRVELHGIDSPPKEFGTPDSVFESVLEHERAVTGMINRLYELSGRESDWAAQQELQWFIVEQVEEEDAASTALDQVRMAGEDKGALLMLDERFGSRSAESEEA